MSTLRDEIYQRQIASLRWYYQGRLAPLADDATPNAWVCCRFCGALYALPAELAESHRCPVRAARETDYGDCHWCGKTGWRGPLLCTTCHATRGQVCPTCQAQLNGPCDGCADRVTGWEPVS